MAELARLAARHRDDAPMRACLSRAQLLAVIGEQFDETNDVCGVTLSLRPHEDSVALWDRNSEDRAAVEKHK